MEWRVKLRGVEGLVEGMVFDLSEPGVYIVGRSSKCHIQLPKEDRTVSGRHFLIEVAPPAACVMDLGSLGGTYVNGRKIGGRREGEAQEEVRKRAVRVDLRHGDVIQAGRSKMVFEVARDCVVCGREVVGGKAVCEACAGDTAPAVKAPLDSTITCASCGASLEGLVHTERGICDVCLQMMFTVTDPLSIMKRLLERARVRRPDVPGFDVERTVGGGGMAWVFLVRDERSGERVAMKVMRPRVKMDDREYEQRKKMFLREMGLLGEMRHPNIVDFYGAGSFGDILYFTMEYCPHGSLQDYIKRCGGRVRLRYAVPIMLGVLRGLAYIHGAEVTVRLADGRVVKKRGVVHRDLKPQNILFAERDGKLVAKVADLGLAKCFETAGLSGLTKTEAAAGTIPYMPVDQLECYKYVKPTADVWAIGATFFYMLTGRLPRDLDKYGDPVAGILKEKAVPIRTVMPELPAPIAEVIDRALEFEPEDRYQDCGQMLRAMEDAVRKVWRA